MKADRFASARPLERSLGVRDGLVLCPRRGRLAADECDTCRFYCRGDTFAASVICSYPFVARETFAWRSRRRHDVRIALHHTLDRT